MSGSSSLNFTAIRARPLPINWQRIDYTLQAILLIAGTIGLFAYLMGSILFIPLGGLQNLSALVWLVGGRDRTRRRYAVLTVLWYLLVGLCILLEVGGNYVGAVFGLAAYALAVYYFMLTKQALKEAKANKDAAPPELVNHLV